MLRITTEETNEAIRIYLEGKLSGPWVAELEQSYSAERPKLGSKSLFLDLGNLTGMDAAGRYLIALIQQEGAVLENASDLANLQMWPGAGALPQRGRAVDVPS